MNRLAQCLLCTFLFTGIIYAQPAKKEYNCLLWRISGNGLSTPSYVYGTMHLTDKRIFNFSDSLYYFLEHSQGFAAELDMGELMPEMISAMNNKKNENLFIKDLVSKERLAPFKQKLEKILKKSIEKITVKDLSKAKSKTTNEIIKAGEMPTIIDVYLYDIARRQGKWVGGIEDFEDQFTPEDEKDEIMSSIYEITEDQNKVNEKVEWMIKTYLNQRLDSIDLTSQLWKGAELDKLITRNKKMARRMDSIMQIRTCLFAVGAAHIPGDSGVVTLLRRRGFKVEPVYSAKKIAPEKYTFQSKDIPWVNAAIKDDWYSVSMPGKPDALKMGEEESGLAAQLYFDLTKMSAYFTFSIPSPEKNINEDSIYIRMARNFAKTGKIISQKNIRVNGTAGKEFLIKSDENDMRLQTFLPESAVIINIISSNKPDSLFGKDALRFFESFKILKAAPVSAAPPALSWQKYSFPQHAFSIKFPSLYKEQVLKNGADTSWKTHFFTTTVNKGNFSCWIVVMEAKSGFYANSDSGYFELTKKAVLANLKIDSAAFSKQSFFHEYPLYEFHVNAKYQNDELQLKARIVNRGNRRYYFYTVYNKDEGNLQMADSFLNSFEFLPLPVQSWSYQSSPAKDFAIWAPAPLEFLPGKDSAQKSTNYILYDSASPATLLIYKKPLSVYSWWKNDSAFFRQQANSFIGVNDDSLKDYKLITDGPVPQADFSVVSKDNHVVDKVRLLLNGDSLYYVFGYMPPDLAQSENYSKLYNGIKITKIIPAGFHLTNKTSRILSDLSQGDSTAFKEASDALKDAEFTAAHLPQLHKALLKPYRDFDPEGYGTHRNIIDKILDIDNGTTLPFIKNNYTLLKDSNEKLQYSFLYTLLGLKTKESFDLFKEIISKRVPVQGDVMMLRYKLTDSLKLTASIFPDMLRLSADTGFIKLLPFVANELLDSGLVTTSSFDTYKKYFYGLAGREIQRMKRDVPDYDITSYRVVDFLSHFNEPEANQLLQQFLSLSSISIKKNAAMRLIKNGQRIDPLQLEKIAKDNYFRIDFYEELKELKKENLFPLKYNNQRSLAQSELCQTASDDYDADSVIFVGERTALFMGKQQRFFLFKVVYKYEEGETESHLGVTGPYPKTGGKIIPRSDVSGTHEEEYDVKKINTHLKEFLKIQEDYFKEDQED